MDTRLLEHLETLRRQGAHTARTLRTTADLLDRLLERPLRPGELDELRSQLGAALSSTRTSKQLAARAAELLETDTAARRHSHGSNRASTVLG